MPCRTGMPWSSVWSVGTAEIASCGLLLETADSDSTSISDAVIGSDAEAVSDSASVSVAVPFVLVAVAGLNAMMQPAAFWVGDHPMCSLAFEPPSIRYPARFPLVFSSCVNPPEMDVAELVHAAATHSPFAGVVIVSVLEDTDCPEADRAPVSAAP